NADGSVGFPHVRVGHRQIEFSAKAKTKQETLWLAITTGFLLLSAYYLFANRAFTFTIFEFPSGVFSFPLPLPLPKCPYIFSTESR
ncbi:hypothetical protein V2H39_10705, partial [Actinobacillus pleuropneumoniae]|uniref:hypothetical protein n=3 Tax=Actinobacillus pleuropneumoniae TaxID=715 RepID=UPI002EB027D8|nr:hypothetical protein [Actinobacillus pleuropneumoniae]